MRIIRRNLRDNENPFEMITEEHFIQIYRFPKHLCRVLIDEIIPFLESSSRIHALPAHTKVLCTLRFFAQGSFQRAVGQDYLSSLSQTSVSRCITEVAIALNCIANRHVKFPRAAQFLQIKRKFFDIAGFPGVIGLIDGTHIKIAAPRKEIEHVYYCRKGGHSKNVQIICGADHLIFSANARFGGTSHDSYIWRCSKTKTTLERLYSSGERNFYLLGDGYPLQPWLMTPILESNSNGEEAFNKAHKITRSIVERCIGILKSRFRCLAAGRVLYYAPGKAGVIINACIVLHNMLIKARIPLNEDLLIEAESQDEREIAIRGNFNERNVLAEARNIRQQIVRNN
ncbi:putative nuclease HARBI1, partial [Episyrphus balteatus]|uniref:putative nuclease HARBI1 n=1 Tax=Episyrphus balteatus TaxID=286459 RepID=UPI002485BCB8